MAETSALSFSTFTSIPSVSRSRSAANSFLFSSFPSYNHSHLRSHRPYLRFTCKASDPGDDLSSLFPWSDGDNAIEWVQEEKVTLFTTDGLIQIGGNIVPRLVSASDKKRRKSSKISGRLQRFQESDYMDPDQSLCLGALFDIAATNGLDMGRRLCILGFCRSIEMLSDVVEDTVLEHGGEVVAAEKAVKGGLHEKLKMTVAVPYLWGVPPASETLRLAVKSGGGIVDKVYWQWDFL
ncbi:hypothetical protein LINPERHAP2_LOCUS13460 [Linum perenne]